MLVPTYISIEKQREKAIKARKKDNFLNI